VELDEHCGPFQPRPFYDSVISVCAPVCQLLCEPGKAEGHSWAVVFAEAPDSPCEGGEIHLLLRFVYFGEMRTFLLAEGAVCDGREAVPSALW